jgi:MYXO-CTERM domain-containing protein
VDPNFLEATPATNALGYGLTTDGGTIAYTIHYENIGGAAAHGVGIVTVLDPDLDAQTLVVGSGGTFDGASRTLSWLDPVLPPQVPRSVTFSAKVRPDAPPRTRVWAQATVIFPDAFPPSRTDTNALVHVVPYPDQPIQPALAVYRCIPVSGSMDQWTAVIENRGFGFAYDVSAAIKSAPASVTVSQGTTSFSDIHDPTPDRLASVIPLASTASRTPVSFTSPSSPDPCATMTWEISYSTSDGKRLVSDIQAAADLNGNGIPDYLETDGGVDAGTGGNPRDGGVDGPVASGCACSATGPDVLVAPVLLALAVLVQLGRRRPS